MISTPILLLGFFLLVPTILLVSGIWAAWERDKFAQAVFALGALLTGFVSVAWLLNLCFNHHKAVCLGIISVFLAIVVFLLCDAFISYLYHKL